MKTSEQCSKYAWMASLLLFMSTVNAMAQEQGATQNFDGEWLGVLACGPQLAGQTAHPEGFNKKIALKVEGSNIKGDWQGPQGSEAFNGNFDKFGGVWIDGRGQFKFKQGSYLYTASGAVSGHQLAASGQMITSFVEQQGFGGGRSPTKLRDCTFSLQNVSMKERANDDVQRVKALQQAVVERAESVRAKEKKEEIARNDVARINALDEANRADVDRAAARAAEQKKAIEAAKATAQAKSMRVFPPPVGVVEKRTTKTTAADSEKTRNESLNATRNERERDAADRLSAEKAANERNAAERAAIDRLAAESAASKAAIDRATAEKANNDRLAAQRVAAEKNKKQPIRVQNAMDL